MIGVNNGRKTRLYDPETGAAGHLLWHGVDPEVTLELLRCWNAHRCAPPLPDEEVVRTVQSTTQLHETES